MKTLPKIGTSIVLGSAAILISLAFLLDKPVEPNSSEDPAVALTAQAIPELLVRNTSLKQTAEWEKHVNRVNELRSALIAKPEDVSPVVELAQIYAIEARVTGEHGYYFPSVLKMLDAALSHDNLNKEVRFEATALKANILLSQHRWHDGLAWAEKAHAINPYSAQVYSALIDANVELGQYDRALELAEGLMEFRPGLMAYARASFLMELHGNVDGAIDAMKMAVEAGYPGYENTEWCRLRLGELYEQKGKLEIAEGIYRMSMQYREDNPFAQAAIARVSMHRGDFEAAEKMLLTALEAVPEISFQEDLYRLYLEWGKETEAREAYTGIIEMIEDDAAHGHQVDLDYAVILFELGSDTNAAMDRVQREYEIRPDNIAVNSLMARIYAARGDMALARTHYAKATRTGFSNDALAELSESF